jgi:hypothetical protein
MRFADINCSYSKSGGAKDTLCGTLYTKQCEEQVNISNTIYFDPVGVLEDLITS